MADIDRELFDIWNGQFGIDIRMPIHDALMKIAWETPTPDPSQIPNYTYIIANDGSYLIASEGDYIVAKNDDLYFVVANDSSYMIASEGDYITVKE